MGPIDQPVRGRYPEQVISPPELRPGPHKLVLSGLLLGVCAGLSACEAATQVRTRKLAEAAQLFNSGVRWRKHQQAASLLYGKELQSRYLDRAEKADEELQISGVIGLRTTFSHQATRARLRYRYEWHLKAEGLLRRSVVVQHWRHRKGTWSVVGVRHARGDRFPLFEGLAEKPERPRARPHRPAGSDGAKTR